TSTWSLHRVLGPVYWDSPAKPHREPEYPYGPGNITLLELPARLAQSGIHTLEICHFHLPSREISYINELRAALKDAGVELFSLLIDDGDITHPEFQARDMKWISGWIEIAGALGAKATRVIAGKTVDSGALDRSKAALAQLATVAENHGVRLMTENWFSLLGKPEQICELLGSLDGRVGLCVDFGNWKGLSKYDDLQQIFPLAESCHAKCSFSGQSEPDTEDYLHCLDLSRAAGFSGPYTLIHDGRNDDCCAGIKIERQLVLHYLS